MERIDRISYKNEFTENFPGDESGNRRPRQTPGVLWSKALPTPVREPKLLAWSEALAAELGISRPTSQEEVDVLGGNNVTAGMRPYAACYAGHQFGNWAGQLGDGRAITLSEMRAPDGRSFELQLKGPGPTPYSRRADGRAVLRSSLREYICSEAMHFLGVPTTRALSLVSTGEQVMRDMFYDGNPEYEPGAIVMRVAPSFLRFGNFEILAARQELDNLRRLTDWTIEKHYPHITGEDKVLQFFTEVVDRTAAMIVEWVRVGFVHGVMNTDNMSILGATIDYGPFSFLDDYDLNFTPNTTDLPGRRYAFGKQSSIGYWNLGCLAGALLPLLPSKEPLVQALETYEGGFWKKYYGMMAAKLGLDEARADDVPLIRGFEKTLNEVKPDMTIFFQLLATLDFSHPVDGNTVAHFSESFYNEPGEKERAALTELLQEYETRIKTNTLSPEERTAKMQRTNPRFIPRNYLLHQAIEGVQDGDDSLFRKLEEAIRDPYSQRFDEFLKKRPDWAGQKAGCSMLSCSS